MIYEIKLNNTYQKVTEFTLLTFPGNLINLVQTGVGSTASPAVSALSMSFWQLLCGKDDARGCEKRGELKCATIASERRVPGGLKREKKRKKERERERERVCEREGERERRIKREIKRE